VTCPNYHVGDTVSKLTEPQRLWETDRGVLQVDRNALFVPVIMNGSLEGYVCHGHGKFVLDAIVDTREGAVGKAVEKELSLPFLMLGNTDRLQRCLSPVGQEDLTEMGHVKREEFFAKAEDLLDRFSRRGRTSDCGYSGTGVVFAFQDEAKALDVLVAKGEKLVYTTVGSVFVSNGDRAVMGSPGGFVCVRNGKSVIVRR
jgi:hypothetical protein